MFWRGGHRFRSLAGDRRAVHPRAGARLVCAAALVSLLSVPALAQPADLDPSAPLDPMPELGVEWPDLDAPDRPVVAAPEADQGTEELPDAPPLSDDAAAELRYSVALEGLEQVATEELTASFDAQSALRKGRKDPTNAAQVDRRSRADAELLAELLRSQGYYDAIVRAADRPNGGRLGRRARSDLRAPNIGSSRSSCRVLRPPARNRPSFVRPSP